MVLNELSKDYGAGAEDEGLVNDVKSFIVHLQSQEGMLQVARPLNNPGCFTPPTTVSQWPLGQHWADTRSTKDAALGSRIVVRSPCIRPGCPQGATPALTTQSQCGFDQHGRSCVTS